ncbi:hypothetical protein D3C72_2450220 [compost metagenome]
MKVDRIRYRLQRCRTQITVDVVPYFENHFIFGASLLCLIAVPNFIKHVKRPFR